MKELINNFNRLKGKKEALEQDISSLETNITKGTSRQQDIEMARELIRQAALQTQKQLEYPVSEIVTLALGAVFDNPYELKLDFVERRGKTEADISFVRDGKSISPLDASGGGAIDIASTALRFSLWSLQPKKTRNTIILDEPFKHLSENYQVKASKMLKEISEKLGLQIIMVTHNPHLIECADKVFTVGMRNRVSELKE
jgi:chromosome segregation ATPase